MAQVGQAALVAEWKFDDASGTTTVDSVGIYDGTMPKSTEWTNGVSGGALNFANTNLVTFPAGVFATVNNEVTISMWLFGNELQPDDGISFRANDIDGVTTNRVISINVPFRANVIFDAGNTGNSYDRLSKSANAVSYKGDWNHWVFTKDAANSVMSIYLNGGLFAIETGKMHPITRVDEVYMGLNGSLPYQGLMDEIRLYDSALSAEEVNSLFDSYGYAVTNLLPIANAQNVNTPPDSPLDITLTGTDPEGMLNLIYTVVDEPIHGSFTATNGLTFTYTPDPGYSGSDSFTFTINDGRDNSAPATISIAVANLPPMADSKSVITLVDTEVAITLSGSDPEGSNVTYSVGIPSNGAWSGIAPNLTYTPNTGFVGNDSFTYTVNDGTQDSAPATVSILVTAATGGNEIYSATPENSTLFSNNANPGGSLSGATPDLIYFNNFNTGNNNGGWGSNDDIQTLLGRSLTSNDTVKMTITVDSASGVFIYGAINFGMSQDNAFQTADSLITAMRLTNLQDVKIGNSCFVDAEKSAEWTITEASLADGYSVTLVANQVGYTFSYTGFEAETGTIADLSGTFSNSTYFVEFFNTGRFYYTSQHKKNNDLTLNISTASIEVLGGSEPEPTPAALTFAADGNGNYVVGAADMESSVLNTLQYTASLVYTNWISIATTSGVASADWLVPATNPVSFFRVISE